MEAIGLRDLRDHLSEVVERVERGEVIEITKHGQPVARIVPVPQAPDSADVELILADLDALAAQIGAHWKTDRSAVDAVRDVRREL